MLLAHWTVWAGSRVPKAPTCPLPAHAGCACAYAGLSYACRLLRHCSDHTPYDTSHISGQAPKTQAHFWTVDPLSHQTTFNTTVKTNPSFCSLLQRPLLRPDRAFSAVSRAVTEPLDGRKIASLISTRHFTRRGVSLHLIWRLVRPSVCMLSQGHSQHTQPNCRHFYAGVAGGGAPADKSSC